MASIKLNISNPATGAQKTIEIEDEKKYRVFLDKRIAAEVPGDTLGDEFKGYIFKITGGMDKQGFAMKQGVLLNTRVNLLLDGESGHYRNRRTGDRRRKAVRGCIVGSDISVLNLVIVKKGDADLPGLTDKDSFVPRRLGPKRASKIRKLFNLTKEDDVRQFVIRRQLPKKEGKKQQTRAPKVQRLVTPVALRRKRVRLALKKERYAKQTTARAAYEKTLAQLRKDQRHALLSKKRSQAGSKAGTSTAKSTGAAAAATTTPTPAPAPAPAKDTGAKKTEAKKKTEKPAKAAAPAKTAAPAKAAPAKHDGAAAPAAAKKGGKAKAEKKGK